MAQQTGFMLINLGTPDAPETGPVRRYLREFLSDPRVLDIPAPLRAFLLNAIILPTRPKASAAAYRKVWTDRGSPLLYHGLDLGKKVGDILGDSCSVRLAMRYGNPSISAVLDDFRSQGIDRIVAFPLFPQYSSAAFGSAVEKLFVEANKRWNLPTISVIPPYYDHPAFIRAFAAVARPVFESLNPDYVVMSYHGVPERQIRRGDDSGGQHCLRNDDCCAKIGFANRNCYRAQCFASSRALAAELGLDANGYEVTFQSRLGRDPWIQPYTDDRVEKLAHDGKKRLALLCPAFTADCLETIEEIGMEAREEFIEAGGDDLRLVPSLNSTDEWARAVVEIASDSVRFAEPALASR